MNIPTPAAARDLAANLIPLVVNVAPGVLEGDELAEFNHAADVARATCDLPATSATCGVIEQKLRIMLELFGASPRFRGKPAEQVETVVGCFEIARSACYSAARMGSLH